MPLLSTDKIRLRVPLTAEELVPLRGKPRKLRRAQLAQRALAPEHALPLNVGWWPDTPDHVVGALRRATDLWNRRMEKREYVEGTFRLVGSDYPGPKDLMVGVKVFEPLDFKHQFGSTAAGAFGVHGEGTTAPMGRGEELGDCELFWDVRGRVIAGRIFIPDDLSLFDSACTLAHELGHGLLLGHDPIHPWRLMYKDHTGVRGPKPKECEWVARIWT